MPITKSAAKAMRQNIRHRRRNLQLKQAVKSEFKALTAAIAEGNQKLIAGRLAAAQSKLDKAAKRGVIHTNKAARKKSQLAKLIKAGSTKTKVTTATKKSASKKPPKPASGKLVDEDSGTKPESSKG